MNKVVERSGLTMSPGPFFLQGILHEGVYKV